MDKLAKRQAEIQQERAELDKEQEEIQQRKMKSSFEFIMKVNDSARKIAESAGNKLNANRAGDFNEGNETQIQTAGESESEIFRSANIAALATGAMIDGKGTAQQRQAQFYIMEQMFDFFKGKFSHEEQQAFFNVEDSQERNINKALDECPNGLELHSAVSEAQVC